MIHNLDDIKKLRKKLELTQTELAELSGVSQSFIAKIETGKIQPSFEKIKKISYSLENLGEKNRQKLKDVMTRKVITCSPMCTVEEIIQMMKKYNISQLPVSENDKIVGLVSETTILDKMSEGEDITSLEARDVMHVSPPIVNYQTPSIVVSQLLKHFPIVLVSEKGKIKGLISKYDMLAVASKVK